MPLVSVVMSVYNCEKYIYKSIDSILLQTFTGFEFIIINDGSTDGTLNILREYEKKDNRITIYNQSNKGLTASLNFGIGIAKGKYIARQDADDISLPTRFEKQVYFLENNNAISLLGTNNMEVINGKEKLGNYYEFDYINKRVFLYSPFAHTSVMFRKEIFVKIGLYNESFKTSQDFEAWMRFAKYGKISMLDEILVKLYRANDSVSSTWKFNQIYNAWRARRMHQELGVSRIIIATLYQFLTAYLPDWIITIKRNIHKRK